MRILNCVPRMGSELHEKIIPAETGLIELSVSFTKGCYTGQELVARIDSRGNNTPRNLLLIASNHNFSIGNQVEVNEKLAGAITSVAKEGDLTVGLAYLSRNVTSPTVGKIEGKEVFVNSPKDFLG
jgi:folate-binding protein YgfZ